MATIFSSPTEDKRTNELKTFTFRGNGNPLTEIPKGVEKLALTFQGIMSLLEFGTTCLRMRSPLREQMLEKTETLFSNVRVLVTDDPKSLGILISRTKGQWFQSVEVLDLSMGAKDDYFSAVPSLADPHERMHIRYLFSHKNSACWKKLEEVVLPQNLESIEGMQDLKFLKRITIPATVQRFGDRAFANATNIRFITIPKATKRIGRGAFFGCHKLQAVRFECSFDDVLFCIDNPENEDDWSMAISSPEPPFDQCYALCDIQLTKKDVDNVMLWPRIIHTFWSEDGMLQEWGIQDLRNRRSCLFHFLTQNIAPLFNKTLIEKSWETYRIWSQLQDLKTVKSAHKTKAAETKDHQVAAFTEKRSPSRGFCAFFKRQSLNCWHSLRSVVERKDRLPASRLRQS